MIRWVSEGGVVEEWVDERVGSSNRWTNGLTEEWMIDGIDRWVNYLEWDGLLQVRECFLAPVRGLIISVGVDESLI